MRMRVVAVLILSHVGLALLGGWLASGKGMKTAPVIFIPDPVVSSSTSPKRVEKASANPILRASGADFRAAWDEMLVGPRTPSGEPHGDSINFFIDWCAVDPEGAVRGLSRLRAPRFAHNYLGNALNYHGAELAPALVKHWRELRQLADYKVEHALGRSLNALAKEDPETAVALLDELPPGARRETYDELFDRQDAATIERLVKSLPTLDPAAEGERARLWTAVASAVDRAEPERGLWNWLARTDDPAACRAFAAEGMDKARRTEDWTGFFDAVDQLKPAVQAEVREVLRQRARNSGDRPEVRAAISEECKRHGLGDWLAEPTGE